MSHHKSSRLRILFVCLICSLAIIIPSGYLILRMGHQYRSWHKLSAIQLLGNSKEAWVFLERDVVVEHPSWGRHRRRTMAQKQDVIIITTTGLKKTISVPESRGPTFHRSISRVIRQEDRFYLLRDPSKYWYGSLFEWQEDHFELLPLKDYDAFLSAQALDNVIGPVFEPALDRLTEKNGWKHLGAGVDLFRGHPFHFTWNARPFEITVELEPPLTRVRLNSIDPGQEWHTVLLEFDAAPKTITQAEYYELWNREKAGYPKPGY